MIYDFECTKCGKVEERICTKEEADNGFKCNCGKPKARLVKQFPNKSTFILKGRWYKTTKGY